MRQLIQQFVQGFLIAGQGLVGLIQVDRLFDLVLLQLLLRGWLLAIAFCGRFLLGQLISFLSQLRIRFGRIATKCRLEEWLVLTRLAVAIFRFTFAFAFPLLSLTFLSLTLLPLTLTSDQLFSDHLISWPISVHLVTE